MPTVGTRSHCLAFSTLDYPIMFRATWHPLISNADGESPVVEAVDLLELGAAAPEISAGEFTVSRPSRLR